MGERPKLFWWKKILVFLLCLLILRAIVFPSSILAANTYDLSTSTNYNLRFDGAVDTGYFPTGSLRTADLDNNGKPDLIVGSGYTDYNSRTNSGSLYIIYDSLIDDYSATGNNIDLSISSHYNLRFDGAKANDYLSDRSLTIADLDNDGKQDLLIGTYAADNNSRTDSGSLYIIFNTLIDNYTGTGNNIDLASSVNYNLRYDGAAASDQLSYGAVSTADLDNDGRQDLLISDPYTDNNLLSNSGSLYLIYNTLIDNYTGTGNNIDLLQSANYNLRYDGASVSGRFSYWAVHAADLDNDRKSDLLVGEQRADFNLRANSGSFYVIYNTLIDDYSGTSNNIDISVSSNYNLRYDGAANSDTFPDGALTTGDLDNDGKQDILAGSAWMDNNSLSSSGSLFVIYNTLVDDYSGTGNNIDLLNSANYNLRYDGGLLLISCLERQ